MTSDEAEASLPRSATMSLWREACTASLSQILSILMTFALAILLTNVLPPADVGLYYFMYATVLLLAQVSLGIGRAVRKRVSERSGKRSTHFWSGATVTLGYALLVGVVAVGLGGVLATSGSTRGIVSSITPLLIVVTFLSFFTRGFLELSEMYLSGLGYPGRANWLGAAAPSVLTTLLSSIVAVGFNGGVPELLAVTAISYFMCTLAILALARPAVSGGPSLETSRSLLSFARWSVPNTVLNDFYHRFDTLILGVLVGAVSVGYYDASVRMVTFGFALSFGLGAATSVNVSGRHAQDLPVAPVLRNVTEAAAIITFPLVVGFALVGDALLVGFYGPEYELAFYYLVGLAIQQILQGYRVTFEGFFEGVNKPHRNVRASVIAVAVNVLTAIPLVLWLGGIGVVVSTILADLIRVHVFRQQAVEQLGAFPIPRLVAIQLAAAVGLFLVLQPLLTTIDHTLWTALATLIGVIALYFGLLSLVSVKIRRIARTLATRASP